MKVLHGFLKLQLTHYQHSMPFELRWPIIYTDNGDEDGASHKLQLNQRSDQPTNNVIFIVILHLCLHLFTTLIS